jgi:hypothetical protein
MADKVNLAEKLTAFDEAFSLKIVGQLNDYWARTANRGGRG